jgi:hypothetical protein
LFDDVDILPLGRVNTVKNVCKLVVMTGLMFLSLTIPAIAQIANGVDFTTSFPFYAGNAKMPAGAYTITQPQGEDNLVLEIHSTSGSYSTFLDITPTEATNPHPQSDVTFNRYGTTDYLNQVWVSGQNYGLRVVPTKVEQNAASKAAAVSHSISANAR